MTHDLMIARAGRSCQRLRLRHESPFSFCCHLLIRFFQTIRCFTVDECLTPKSVCCVIHPSDSWSVWSLIRWASHWHHMSFSSLLFGSGQLNGEIMLVHFLFNSMLMYEAESNWALRCKIRCTLNNLASILLKLEALYQNSVLLPLVCLNSIIWYEFIIFVRIEGLRLETELQYTLQT